MSPAARDWDAATYDRVSDPMLEWGAEVLDRLSLDGGETVLDAGCGSGRVTRLLAERLPRGRVIAVDSAPSMVERAQEALGAEAEVFVADLTELELGEPADAAISTAVFHWIPDHERLFARLHHALRPRGRLEAQCGGEGNLDGFHGLLRELCGEPPFREHLGDWRGPWNFASPRASARRLEQAGFTEVECWLERRDVTTPDAADYLRTVCLGHHLERLPEALRDELVERVVGRAGEPLALDYVRLNISARRG